MEHFDIVDEHGTPVGRASRKQCHNGTFLLHPVVHVFVFRPSGTLILQKRAVTKDIQPGKWDTSVGGHIQAGESLDDALIRETAEELGIRSAFFERMYSYIMTSDIERELVTTFRCIWDGDVHYQKEEIDEIRSFPPEEIERHLKAGFFTPNFEEEWQRYKNWIAEKTEE